MGPPACGTTTGSAPSWVREHWGDTLQPALIQHIELTLIGGRDRLRDRVRARARRLPLPAFSTRRSGRSATSSTRIPSIALFQLLVPVTGLDGDDGRDPARRVHAVHPLSRTSSPASAACPPEVLESARGMGLTRRQTFCASSYRLRCRRSWPACAIATVSTISIATDRGVRHPLRPRSADLRRARPAGHLPDRACRGRRPDDPARPHRRRPARARCNAPSRHGAAADDARLALRRRAPVHPRPRRTAARTRRPRRRSSPSPRSESPSSSPCRSGSGSATGTGASSSRSACPRSAARCRASRSSVIFIAWLGVGFWNNTAALVVLGIPPILTNAYFAVEGVDRDVVEAARGMGLSERQILTGVELPLGLPLLLAGVRIAAVFVIATATIAGIAGGGGLGEIMCNLAVYNESGVLAAALCVAAMALADRISSCRSFSARPRAGWLRERRVSRRTGPERVKLERRAWMFRKHTRRAAKAAFAISFGVALLIGLTACGGGGGGNGTTTTSRRRRSRRSLSARRTSARSTSSASSTGRR